MGFSFKYALKFIFIAVGVFFTAFSCSNENNDTKDGMNDNQIKAIEKPVRETKTTKDDSKPVEEVKKIPDKDTVQTNAKAVDSAIVNEETGMEIETEGAEEEASDVDTLIVENITDTISVDTLNIAVDSVPPLLGKTSVEEQNALAEQIFDEIGGVDSRNFSALKILYWKIIDECPDTKEAQIAYYRLANIYLFEESEADYGAVVELLKDFPAKYPKSHKMGVIIPLLIRAYEETEQPGKAIAVYDKLFKSGASLSDKDFITHSFKYAQALEKTGRIKEAVKWYKKTVEKEGRGNSYLVSLAKDRLAALEAPGE